MAKYNSCIVGKGYKKQEGIDYEATLAYVAKVTTIRVVIALTTQFNWPCFPLDASNAFLYGELQ